MSGQDSEIRLSRRRLSKVSLEALCRPDLDFENQGTGSEKYEKRYATDQ
jgi:hypothetical protein